MTELYGLLHIPKAETILTGSKEYVNSVLSDFNIFLSKNGGYYYFTDPRNNHVTWEYPTSVDGIELIREELEIYKLSEQQINALDKDYYDKVVSN